jgi:ADP-ribosyl-[dinitrogen reductase] hydrolase
MLTKAKGTFIGLAIGDALGAPVQFKKRGSFKITYYTSGGRYKVKVGEYTDDTAMALCLGDSLLRKGFDLKDQLDTYLKWLEDGLFSSKHKAFDIGQTVFRSLSNYKRKGDLISPLRNEKFSGNGSIMRLAPVVIYFHTDFEKAVFYSGESSKTTHSSPIAVDSAKLLGAILWWFINGSKKDEVLAKIQKLSFHPALSDITGGSFLHKKEDEIKSSGYAIDTLEAALWCFYNTNSFEKGLIKAVNLGDDADTVGAVYGQIAGAYYGIDNIDEKLIRPVKNHELILQMAENLYKKGLNEFSKQ